MECYFPYPILLEGKGGEGWGGGGGGEVRVNNLDRDCGKKKLFEACGRYF